MGQLTGWLSLRRNSIRDQHSPTARRAEAQLGHALRRVLRLASLMLCVIGCGSASSPTAPTQPAGPVAARSTPAEIGEVIRTQVTVEDVPCDFGYYCKFFEVRAPRDGTLEIGLTHAPGRIFGPPGSTPVDMWVTGGANGPVWMDVHYPDVEAFARVPAIAGGSFQVAVVSYEMPGVSFQLRFLLKP